MNNALQGRLNPGAPHLQELSDPLSLLSSQPVGGRRVGEATQAREWVGGGQRITWREVILRAPSMRIQVTVSEQGGVLREP